MTALPIAVLISGGGTTLKNLLVKKQWEDLPIDIRLVLSSNPQARGLEYAQEANIPSLVVEKKRGHSAEEYSSAIFDPCRQAGVELVVMGGFLKHVSIPPDFENRVLNIHPSLIPAFCGQGMYGLKVHQAVLDYGAKVSGCTVHLVDNEYDHGPIVMQSVVPVLDADSAETLQQRVFIAECEAYPKVLRAFAENRVQIVGRKIRLDPIE